MYDVWYIICYDLIVYILCKFISYGASIIHTQHIPLCRYDPVGWGIPYSNLLASDTAKQVMEHATHTLCILLDYGHPIHHTHIPANTTLPYIHPQNTDAQGFNIYRKLLCDIHSPSDLQFIYTGFVRLLHNVYEAENTYLPHSITCIHTQQELLVLLWKFIEEVPAFLPYILKHGDVNEVGPSYTYTY
ncbi:hypothetical protein EON63_05485 [archaeon]|nr:MAG: hypothetical protein EON63_05485 [archaeon]